MTTEHKKRMKMRRARQLDREQDYPSRIRANLSRKHIDNGCTPKEHAARKADSNSSPMTE